MRRKVVVVVPRLASEALCSNCANPISRLPFCERCHTLAELPETLTHFEILGVPQSLLLEAASLQARFYELSKKVHPDLFVTADPRQMMLSARWTSAINKAYQTLRDQDARSRYLLELEHGDTNAGEKAKMPLDLADSYFELQDLLTESGDMKPLLDFRTGITERLAGLDDEWTRIAKSYESGNKGPALSELGEFLNKKRFLRSMLADLEKRLEVGNANSRN